MYFRNALDEVTSPLNLDSEVRVFFFSPVSPFLPPASQSTLSSHQLSLCVDMGSHVAQAIPIVTMEDDFEFPSLLQPCDTTPASFLLSFEIRTLNLEALFSSPSACPSSSSPLAPPPIASL